MPIATSNRRPLRVCFSYAAYAKNLISHLKSFDIPVENGLSDAEFSAVESHFRFTFPPDLRSILQEGLPVGAGFPNWRSSSRQQLEILTNLPILDLCKEVSRSNFWLEEIWGERPKDVDRAVAIARRYLKNSDQVPFLVPIYRHFYIPSSPCMAGNPVFYVHGGEVKVWSFDMAGFFQQVEFMSKDESVLCQPRQLNSLNVPAWAATEARGIEFWSERAEKGEKGATAAREKSLGWWNGDLGGCLDDVWRRLRNGGWKEEEVREMMMMDGRDEQDPDKDDDVDHSEKSDFSEKEDGLRRRVRVLSDRLLSAGWSTEDVAESLGFLEDCYADSCFDFHHHSINVNNQMLNLQSIRV